MKKKILAILAVALGISVAASAQPKAIGGRLGNQLEVSYQHNLSSPNFIEVDLGLDLGSLNYGFGFQATAIYDFVFAQPNWTSRGDWEWYAGPGVALGYGVNNETMGMTLGIAGQIGLSYTFWFPLQLSVDLRPVIGLHFGDGVRFYTAGVTSYWIPCLSVRYAF